MESARAEGAEQKLIATQSLNDIFQRDATTVTPTQPSLRSSTGALPVAWEPELRRELS